MEKLSTIGSVRFLICCPVATVIPITNGDTSALLVESTIGKSDALLYTVKKIPISVKIDDNRRNKDGGSSTEAVGTLDLFSDIGSLASVLKRFPKFTRVYKGIY